ncbi:hypothetical protein WMY93_027574 [Mugilogobius chulae]|uniref:KASH domain-containing protein n=1 Tax=Mugilogobius chulae TaxID=88201 RepID=A0AAW0MUD4_9GOBI
MQTRYNSVSQSSSAGLASSRSELEERERNREELQRLRVWLEAADHLLSEPETCDAQEIKEVLLELFNQKSLLQKITNSINTKYQEPNCVIPAEIDALLQETRQIMQQVEPKVNNAVEKSGPVYRLGAKLSEIQSGLNSVQKRLDQKSPTAVEAKVTQKRVWDELDVWHSCLAALEVEVQDLDKPEEALVLTERLVEVQHVHSQLAKQAEQRTTLLSKVHTWLQEHQEMIDSSKSWISEAKTWLAAPATYTTAKCLSSHVDALQVVLGDSAQIRLTLQGFTLVLEEMSQVCDVSSLQSELAEADREVAEVQDSFTAPLSKLQRAAAEVESIEAEVKKMENDVAEISLLLASPESLQSPKLQRLKVVEHKIQEMQRVINEIQSNKANLDLPEKAEQTLTVFTVVDHLQTLLSELKEKVPALFIPQPDQPRQSRSCLDTEEHNLKSRPQLQPVHIPSEEKSSAPGSPHIEQSRQSPFLSRFRKSPSEECARVRDETKLKSNSSQQKPSGQSSPQPEQSRQSPFLSRFRKSPSEEKEEGEIQIVHVKEDVLKRSGAELLTVEKSSPEQRESPCPPADTQSPEGSPKVDELASGIMWWLWDLFLGEAPQEAEVAVAEEVQTDAPQTEETQEAESEAAGSTPEMTETTETTETTEPQTQKRRARFLPLPPSLRQAPEDSRSDQPSPPSLPSPPLPASLLPSLCSPLPSPDPHLHVLLERVSELDAGCTRHAAAWTPPGLMGRTWRLWRSTCSPVRKCCWRSSRRTCRRTSPTALAEQNRAPPAAETEAQQQRSGNPVLATKQLLRQSSLQQQKELEQELEQQRGLTQDLSSSRSRLQEPPESEQNRPHRSDSSPDSCLLKWDRLFAALHSLDLTLHLPPPSQVADAFIRRGDGAAGRMIGEQARKELRNLVRVAAELGEETEERRGQDSCLQTVDEGAFHLLSSASVSLSALSNLLLSDGVSSELERLSSALESQGSKFACFLGSHRGHECLQTVVKILPVIQSTLNKREAAVRKQLEENATAQNRLKELHAAFTSNQTSVHQITQGAEPPSLTDTLQAQSCLQLQTEELKSLLQNQSLPRSLLQQASQLQEQLDSALLGVSSRSLDLKSSSDLQQNFEQLVLGLRELLCVGSERIHLLQTTNASLQSKEQLQSHVKSHAKFFQFLHQHFQILQVLSNRFPDSSKCVENLKEEVLQLQEKGFETGTRLERLLQLWTQWEQDCEWMDLLLRNTHTSFPIMPQEWDSEQHLENYLSIYQGLAGVLKESSARVSRLLKCGSELHQAGSEGAASVCRKMDSQWKSLTKKVHHERGAVLKIQKLRKGASWFLTDSAALDEWMGGARDMIDKQQARVSTNEEEDICAKKENFLQILNLSKELESRAGLKSAVRTSGSELVRTQNPDLDLDLEQDLDKDQDTEKDSAGPNRVWSRVRQTELRWCSLNADVTTLVQTLNKRWLQCLNQQEALQELQAWLEAAESQLNEQTNSDPDAQWRICKGLQSESAAHQATVDFINQPLQTCSVADDHEGRCERNLFAEAQGRLNHGWTSLQHRLRSQLSLVEQERRLDSDADRFLQKLQTWIQEQKMWTDSNQRPQSPDQIQRSLKLSQELEQKIQLQSEALLELKKKFHDKTGNCVGERISQIDETTLDCDSLRQKNDSLKHRLLEAQILWDSLNKQLGELKNKTVKISQTLEFNSGSVLSLEGLKQLCHRLKLVHEELEASDLDWDKIHQTEASVKNMVHDSASALITEETTELTSRWSKVSDSLNKMLQKSHSALSVWEVYHPLAEAFSQRLKNLQNESTSVTGSSQTYNTEEQFTSKIREIQELLCGVDGLQRRLQEVLERLQTLDLFTWTTPSRLRPIRDQEASRGVLQLSQGLKLKLETLQIYHKVKRRC